MSLQKSVYIQFIVSEEKMWKNQDLILSLLCNGSWRSIWNVEFKDDLQIVDVRGRIQVGAHYFEEVNVQLDAKHECKDSTIFQLDTVDLVIYLGGYDMEAKAARAYDLAALKYWGPSTHINFLLENYQQELEHMKNMTRQEYVAHLRR
ncbi:AP2-like ethylene-responsive transcription factor ANT [Camellia lanceoleosa]|nr:AP2-like ethylene-responsive transcription factor ANT [Camellia lanceoleosa]